MTVLLYPVNGTRPWALTQAQLDAWINGYRLLDVVGECRQALLWIEANPAKRPSAKGMKRFLVGWLNRANAGIGV